MKRIVIITMLAFLTTGIANNANAQATTKADTCTVAKDKKQLVKVEVKKQKKISKKKAKKMMKDSIMQKRPKYMEASEQDKKKDREAGTTLLKNY